MTAAAAWLVEIHTPKEVDFRTSADLQAENQALWGFSAPQATTFNMLLSARSLLPHMQVNPRLHMLLLCCLQEASTEYRFPVLTTKASCRRAPDALTKSRKW
jgi:hypothetical protein